MAQKIIRLFSSVHFSFSGAFFVLSPVLLFLVVCDVVAYPLNAPAQKVGLEDLLLGQLLAALEDAESLGNSQSTVHLA
jgi:hypothetical protein